MQKGKFNFNEERKKAVRKEIESLLVNFKSHSLKNDTHVMGISKVLCNFIESKIQEAFKEVETGWQPAQHVDFPELTPKQKLKVGTSTIIESGGTGIKKG